MELYFISILSFLSLPIRYFLHSNFFYMYMIAMCIWLVATLKGGGGGGVGPAPKGGGGRASPPPPHETLTWYKISWNKKKIANESRK